MKNIVLLTTLFIAIFSSFPPVSMAMWPFESKSPTNPVAQTNDEFAISILGSLILKHFRLDLRKQAYGNGVKAKNIRNTKNSNLY